MLATTFSLVVIFLPVSFMSSISGRFLYQEALRDKTRSGEVPGVLDADVALRLDKPEFRIHVDRDRAADLGVDTTDVATSIRIMVEGDDRVTRFFPNAPTSNSPPLRALTICGCGSGNVALASLWLADQGLVRRPLPPISGV